ncbi:MAG: F0F1 ATP synthase subunit delta [Thermoguttaceae bacterium]
MNRTRQAKRDAKQLFRLCLADGLLDEDRMRQVVERVRESKNRNRFGVLTQLRRLVELDRARHTATVESVAPLPPAMQASVQSEISRVYGPGLSISFIDSPTLIGGMRIKVGSDVYDGSVQARLAALEASFQ